MCWDQKKRTCNIFNRVRRFPCCTEAAAHLSTIAIEERVMTWL
jgi:hypothetical protein